MIRQPEIIYQGNINVKRDGVSHNYTEDEFEEYVKCKKDPAYFAKNYCKIINLDKGLVYFDLYPYQDTMFKHFNENRFNIVLACRQSGKSVAAVAYILWYAIFNPGKMVAILANKGMTAREMVGRITLMLENLPFFLQPGCRALNKGTIEFSNNSTIMSASTSSNSIRGFAINLLYMDEFAFVDNAEKFYTSTYPVITSGTTTKVIITSTANGIGNMYFKLWEGAVQGTNDYRPFRVDWWDVPGRDEKWKERTIANTSQLQFDQEYGNNFLGTGNTLIDAGTLLGLQSVTPEHTFGNINVYDVVETDHDYVMVVDVAQGLGLDYSTFSIIDTTQRPFKQVVTFRDNKISPILFPQQIVKWATLYNEAYVIVENNNQGQLVCNGIYYELEYENLHMESMIKSNGLGITMSTKVKKIGCAGFKDILEAGKLVVVDAQTIQEISAFEQKRNSYEAADGNHDDLVMNLVLFGYFAASRFFNTMTDINLREMLHEQKIKAIEETLVPFGLVDNGIDNNPADLLMADHPEWSIAKDMYDFVDQMQGDTNVTDDPEKSIWQVVQSFDNDDFEWSNDF